VVSFKPPEIERFDVDYDALPSRGELMRLVLNPLRRDRLPAAPGLVTVLMRALMSNRHDFQREMTADDILIVPPIPDAMSFLDWHRHGELFQAAFAWTQDEIVRLAAAGHPSWLASALNAAQLRPAAQ
jgi:NTE family protein